jgi:hypothetical protein
MVQRNLFPKSKLFAWTKGALGTEFNLDDDFQASKLLNRLVQLNVSRRMGTNGNEYNKVENVFAYRNRTARKPEQVVQELEELGYEPEPPPAWPEDN